MTRNLTCAILLMAASCSGELYGQCATSSSPANDCASYGDEIDYFDLNSIPATGNSACGTNGYNLFTTPVWQLQMGSGTTWSANVGSGTEYEGLAIWIDLDSDGNYAASEMVASSAPALTHSGTFTVPYTAVPGLTKMRVRCAYYTTMTGGQACTSYIGTWGETEDYSVNIVSPTPCSGTPGTNNVVTPTAGICPGESAFLNLVNSYTVGDITYQWYASTTSSVGPYTPVPGGTGPSLQTPTLTQNTWYQTVITCTNTGGNVTAAAGMVLVQGTTTNSVPYFEGFEGIPSANELPNCSWSANNLGTEAQTYVSSNTLGRFARTGSKFASFYYSPSGVKTFYSNGIQLEPGITYSASVWYQTDYYGYNNWSDFSLLLGPNQAAAGQVTLASTNGPAVSNVYKKLANTFTVASSGIYYVAIRATGNNSGAQYLSWDDLSITIPCELNAPQLTVAPDQTLCAGATAIISAGGADTYLWSHGATGAVINETPFASTSYTVTGTNTLTGCASTKVHKVDVFPTPEVNIFASSYAVCEGESVQLTAFGADVYLWNTNNIGPVINVTPPSTTSYSVFGSNAYGCQATSSVKIDVNPLPGIIASALPATICQGETTQLQASGADSYIWVSLYSHHKTNPATVSPNVTTAYTVTGTDDNGCEGTQFVMVTVEACVGVTESNKVTSISVFPNPNEGAFSVSAPGQATVEVTDLTGRVVHATGGSDHIRVDVSDLANGVYYVRVSTTEGNEVVRIIKQ